MLEKNINGKDESLDAQGHSQEPPLEGIPQPPGFAQPESVVKQEGTVDSAPLGKGRKNKKAKKPNFKWRSRRKKIIIFAILIFLVIAAFAGYKLLAPKAPTGMPVTTGTAARMDLEEVVTIKGTIEGADTADVSSAMDYEVLSINVKEGDRVSQGQTLASLDASSIQAEHDKSVKNLEQSKFQYDAAQALFAEGAISQEELLKTKTAYENDSITVNSFTGLEQTQIKSPITGIVTRVNTSRGRAANDTINKEAMFVIEDLDHLQMKVKISEYDISKIQIEQTVTITADMLGENSVTGTVSKISPTGELKDSNSKEMAVPVTIDVDKGDTKLIAGVSATAKILIHRSEGVLTVPVDAILESPDTGESAVLVVRKNHLKKAPVTLGIEGNLNVEIVSGKLKDGDSLVLSPTLDMTDGMEVLPMPQQ